MSVPDEKSRKRLRHLTLSFAPQWCVSYLLTLAEGFSAYSGSSSIVFLVAVPFGNLYDSGMLMALYCVTMPLVMMAVADMLDVWIDTLPSQVTFHMETASWSLSRLCTLDTPERLFSHSFLEN